MALGLYSAVDSSSAFTEYGNLTRPFSVNVNGVFGETTDTKIYLRNDNASYYYTSIVVSLVDVIDDITNNSELGLYWKMYAGDTKPTEAQWDLITAASSISLDNIGSLIQGDISTYLPIWVRVIVPRRTEERAYHEVYFQIDANENEIS